MSAALIAQITATLVDAGIRVAQARNREVKARADAELAAIHARLAALHAELIEAMKEQEKHHGGDVS